MDEETVQRLEQEIDELNRVGDGLKGLDGVDGFRTLLQKQLTRIQEFLGQKSSRTLPPSPSLPTSSTSLSNNFPESRSSPDGRRGEGDQLADDVYDFTHAKRGLALIINNEDFQASSNFGPRPGSSYDRVALYKAFKNLGFICLVKDNLTARQMLDTFRLVKDDFDHQNTDCLVCCILTHGDQTFQPEMSPMGKTTSRQDLLYGVDGKAVSTKTMVDMFNDKNCPGLRGKPRLFFLQACRGNAYDHGSELLVTSSRPVKEVKPRSSKDGTDQGTSVDQTDHQPKSPFSSSVDPPNFQPHILGSPDTGSDQRVDSPDAKPEQRGAPSVVTGVGDMRGAGVPAAGASLSKSEPLRDVPVCPAPLYKDCLVMYATPPGYFAWRRKNGAWFVQSLCSVLAEPGLGQTSLLRALVKVCRLVAVNYQSENPSSPSMHQKKETPVIETMLVKDIYLF